MVGTVTQQENLGQGSTEQGEIRFYLPLSPQPGIKPFRWHKLQAGIALPELQVLLGEAWGAGGFICISTVLPCFEMHTLLIPLLRQAIRQAQKAKHKPNRSRKSHTEREKKERGKKGFEVTSTFNYKGFFLPTP